MDSAMHEVSSGVEKHCVYTVSCTNGSLYTRHATDALRNTIGVMFADRAGAGILHWMGWDDHQVFAYTWSQRETVHPRSPGNDSDPFPKEGSGLTSFPSPTRGAV